MPYNLKLDRLDDLESVGVRVYMRNVKPRLSALFASFVAIVGSAFNISSQAPHTDFQLWNETTFVKPILKTKDKKGEDVSRLSVLIFGTLRLGQNRTYPVDRRIGAGFDLRLNENFSISPTYVYRGGEPGRGQDEFEHRIRIDLTFSKKWKKFAIKNRDRVEFRVRIPNRTSSDSETSSPSNYL